MQNKQVNIHNAGTLLVAFIKNDEIVLEWEYLESEWLEVALAVKAWFLHDELPKP